MADDTETNPLNGEDGTDSDAESDEPVVASHCCGQMPEAEASPSLIDMLSKRSAWFRGERRQMMMDAVSQPQPLAGNIYRYMAVMARSAIKEPTDNENDGQGTTSFCSSLYKLSPFHLVSIVVIQILGPIAIIYSQCLKLDWEQVTFGVSGYKDESILGRILAMLFLFGFSSSMLLILKDEMIADRRLKVLLLKDVKLREVVGNGGLHFMHFGRFVNNLVATLGVVAMWIIFQGESDPKDVVFDSLGLAFIVQLDNIASDMGAIGTGQWDEAAFGVFWALIMGSSAAEKHSRDERTGAHQDSLDIRNMLLSKVVEIHNDKARKHNGHAVNYNREQQKRTKPKLMEFMEEGVMQPDKPFDTWYLPRREAHDESKTSWDTMFKYPEVKEYVQSETFVADIYRLMKKNTRSFDLLFIGFLTVFQVLGPITYFFCHIKVKAS